MAYRSTYLPPRKRGGVSNPNIDPQTGLPSGTSRMAAYTEDPGGPTPYTGDPGDVTFPGAPPSPNIPPTPPPNNWNPPPSGASGAGNPGQFGYRSLYAGNDPVEMARQNNLRGIAAQDQFQGMFGSRYGAQEGTEEWARQQAYQQYQPILSGQYTGYTPERSAQLIDQPGLEGLAMTPEEQQGAYLSDWEQEQMGLAPHEQQQITGDPRSAFNYFDPGKLEGYDTESQQRQNEALDRMGAGMTGALRGDKLGLSDIYGSEAGSVYGAAKTGYEGAVDEGKLGLSSDFQSKFPMTDQEKQDIITGAGMDVGARYKATEGAMSRKAAASGLGYLAEGAQRGELERSAAADVGDTMTQARIGASQEAARRVQAGETMRLGAQQYTTGAKMGATESMLTAGQRAVSEKEQLRLQAERDIADRLTNRATTMGAAEIGSAQNVAGQKARTGQYVTTTGMTAEQQAEAAAAQRAAFLGTNRQTAQTNIGLNRQTTQQGIASQRYQRGAYTGEQLYGRRDAQEQTRLRLEAEGRGYLTGQQSQAAQNVNAAGQLAIGGYSAGANAAGQATGQATQYRIAQMQQPKWYERVAAIGGGALKGYATGGWAGAAGGAATGAANPRGNQGLAEGGVVTQPTVALLGEAGPEAVVPLSSRDAQRKIGWGPQAREPRLTPNDVGPQRLLRSLRPIGSYASA